MACSAVRSPLLRNPAVRHYAAAAAAQQCSAAVNPEYQVLNNKIAIAALDNNSPIAQISIVFRAGSRNETYDTQGVTHHLRIAAGLGTQRSSCFGITRNIQQLGGILTAVSDRETFSYTLQITRDKLEKALTFLEDVATKPAFKPWEISDQLPRLRYELSMVPETTRVIELLHKAAYRKGLGYSLYSPKRQLGKINPETLQHFVNNFYTNTRCAVVGTGVSLSEVSAFAQCMEVPTGEGSTTESAKYYGGEVRKDRNSHVATMAVAVESAGLNKENDALAFAVLQRAAGSGPRVKWGSSNSPLNKAVASAAGSDPFAVAAFNASYTDSGLFGFVLSAPPSNSAPTMKAAAKWLRSPTLTDADIARGKADLKAAILYAADNIPLMLENVAQQTILKGQVLPTQALIAKVEKLSASDVKSVASKLSGAKLSMAAIGDLSNVPFLEEL